MPTSMPLLGKGRMIAPRNSGIGQVTLKTRFRLGIDPERARER